MNEHFTRELLSLNTLLANIAEKAEFAVCIALNAVDACNVDLARQVVQGDEEIDRLEIQVEEECLKILALYQPVASNLRQVVTILKVNNDIERVGDLAVSIAERVQDMTTYAPLLEDARTFDFKTLATSARSMLKKALDALTYHDLVAASEVISADDVVDKLHRNNYRLARELILKNPHLAGYYIDGLTISRCLERLADIATNIAEDLIYLEQGRIVRHHHEDENHGE